MQYEYFKWLRSKSRNKRLFSILSTNLHAVCEHDADRHEFGEDPEELRVGQHAVLQAVVQEAGVMAKHVIDVWRLEKEKTDGQAQKMAISWLCFCYNNGEWSGRDTDIDIMLIHSLFSGCFPWCARWAPSPQTSCSTGCSAQSWACAVGGRMQQKTCVQAVWTECETFCWIFFYINSP